MNEAEVVVIQKVLEGLGESFVWRADQQTRLIIWRPTNTTHTKLTSEQLKVNNRNQLHVAIVSESFYTDSHSQTIDSSSDNSIIDV